MRLCYPAVNLQKSKNWENVPSTGFQRAQQLIIMRRCTFFECFALQMHTRQCCHYVVNKNPEFTLKRKTENTKKTQTYKLTKK